MNRSQLFRSIKSIRAGFILLLLVGGCVAGGRVAPQSRPEAPTAKAEPTVTGFVDGRKGYVLSESADLDAEGRRDFDQAVAYLNAEDFVQASELLQPLVDISPHVSAPYIDLAIAYRKLGKPELAEASLKKALDLFPAHPVASNEYGLLLRNAGRFAEAKNIYQQALTIFPDYLPLRINLGILCDLYLNDAAGALEQFTYASAADPGDEQLKLWVAELRLRNGN